MESSSTKSSPPCPCNDCVCVPVCRHKEFAQLLYTCSLLLTWRNENYTVDTWSYRYIIFESLKPHKWVVRNGYIYHDYNTL